MRTAASPVAKDPSSVPIGRRAPNQRGERAEPVAPGQVEGVGGRATAPRHQLDPGDSAPSEIGTDHRGQGPTFQVGALDSRVEFDPATDIGEAEAELDVFDQGALVCLVEAEDPLERLAPHGTKAGPKRSRRDPGWRCGRGGGAGFGTVKPGQGLRAHRRRSQRQRQAQGRRRSGCVSGRRRRDGPGSRRRRRRRHRC